MNDSIGATIKLFLTKVFNIEMPENVLEQEKKGVHQFIGLKALYFHYISSAFIYPQL